LLKAQGTSKENVLCTAGHRKGGETFDRKIVRQKEGGRQFAGLRPIYTLRLLAKILGWVANPVESFGLEYVEVELALPSSEGVRKGMGKQPGSLEQANRGLEDEPRHLDHSFIPP
jgi:hypothetical protein